MRIGKLLNISLAAKCHILFGVAVILILITALLVPWLYMATMVRELNVNLAKQAALTVYSRYALHNGDWKRIQDDLDETWPHLAHQLGLPPLVPELISVDPAQGASIQPDTFERQAIEQLSQDARRYQAQELQPLPGLGRVTRFALAVRRPGPDDPSAGMLGIVSVVVAAKPIWGFTNLYQLVMLGAGVVACMLAIVVFYLITQYLILSPVRDLREVAERIGAGATRLRAEIETGDEFEELSAAFNKMLARQNASQDALDAKIGELAETNVALNEANRLKGEFLANVTHELRTPLTSIIGFAELLRDASEDPAQVDPQRLRHFCENILVSGRMLLDIINDLLDLAKIEAGRMTLHITEFPLSEICEAVVDFTRPLAAKKQLDVRLTVTGEAPGMHSDRGKVQQIFYNLMSNAIKFTPAGGHIVVRFGTTDGGMVWFSVRDSGPGIPVHLQERVFEKFRQLDGSVTREYGGTGLGLPISRELAVVLGGSIGLRSDTGEGTEFIVRLPRVAPSRHAPKHLELETPAPTPEGRPAGESA